MFSPTAPHSNSRRSTDVPTPSNPSIGNHSNAAAAASTSAASTSAASIAAAFAAAASGSGTTPSIFQNPTQLRLSPNSAWSTYSRPLSLSVPQPSTIVGDDIGGDIDDDYIDADIGGDASGDATASTGTGTGTGAGAGAGAAAAAGAGGVQPLPTASLIPTTVPKIDIHEELWRAARTRNYQKLEQLINDGVNIFSKSGEYTLLEYLETNTQLKRSMAGRYIKNAFKLFQLAENGFNTKNSTINKDLINHLLKNGASLNQRNTDRNTPLHVSIISAQPAVFSALHEVIDAYQFDEDLMAVLSYENNLKHTVLDTAAEMRSKHNRVSANSTNSTASENSGANPYMYYINELMNLIQPYIDKFVFRLLQNKKLRALDIDTILLSFKTTYTLCNGAGNELLKQGLNKALRSPTIALAVARVIGEKTEAMIVAGKYFNLNKKTMLDLLKSPYLVEQNKQRKTMFKQYNTLKKEINISVNYESALTDTLRKLDIEIARINNLLKPNTGLNAIATTTAAAATAAAASASSSSSARAGSSSNMISQETWDQIAALNNSRNRIIEKLKIINAQKSQPKPNPQPQLTPQRQLQPQPTSSAPANPTANSSSTKESVEYPNPMFSRHMGRPTTGDLRPRATTTRRTAEQSSDDSREAEHDKKRQRTDSLKITK